MNQIYYVGYDGTHPKDFRYEIPDGFPCYLLVITTTPALFRIGQTLEEYPPYTAILYPPGQPICYGSCGEDFGNHWIRFSSDESFVRHFPNQGTPFSISDPAYCRNLFQLLTWETSQLLSTSRQYQSTGLIIREEYGVSLPSAHEESHLTISQLLRILFSRLHDDVTKTDSGIHGPEILALRRQIATNPQLPWNISDMAEKLHISAGYLQLLYRQQFGLPCMDDVIHCRLHKACDLLSYTQSGVAEIAEQCGYHNTEHFCRQFRKYMDMTPKQFRKLQETKS